jgi:hypothetical protein
MQDKSSYSSNNKPQISEGLQNFINAMVEEIVLKGEAFDEQKKKGLKKYSEAEGLNYTELERKLNDFFELLEEFQKNQAKALGRMLIDLGSACFIHSLLLDKLLSYKQQINLPAEKGIIFTDGKSKAEIKECQSWIVENYQQACGCSSHNQRVYTVKDLLRWLRRLHMLSLERFIEYNEENLDKESLNYFVELSNTFSQEEIFLRLKIKSLKSALGIEGKLIENTDIENRIKILKRWLKDENFRKNLGNYVEFLSDSEIDYALRHLIKIELQNPIEYMRLLNNITYQSGFFFMPIYEKIKSNISEINILTQNLENLIYEIIDPKKSMFSEDYLITNHNFPLEKKDADKGSFIVSLSKIEEIHISEVKIRKIGIRDFQSLLNLIYNNFLKGRVNPNTYGREWAIEDFYGNELQKGSEYCSNTVFDGSNLYLQVKLKR